MLIDLLSMDNYQMFNVKLAKVLGLEISVYISEILSIYGKAVRKNVTDNNFIVVDRSYIESRTTLTPEEQLDIDKVMSSVKLMELDENDSNKIKLDFDNLTSFLTTASNTTLKAVSRKKRVVEADIKKNVKQQSIRSALKKHISTTNLELHSAYEQWIDGVYESNKTLTTAAVVSFQKKIESFSDDLDVVLEIVNIAAVNGLREADWAVERFVKKYGNSLHFKTLLGNGKIEKVELSDEVF